MSELSVKVDGPRLLILGYHRIAFEEQDTWSLCVSPANFALHLAWLHTRGAIVALEDVVRDGVQCDPTFVVTVDDGYADSLYSAKPILESSRIPATTFLPTGWIGSSREFWWDALEQLLLTPGSLPARLELSVNEETRTWALSGAADYTLEESLVHHRWRAWEPAPTPRHVAYQQLWLWLASIDEPARRRAMEDLHVASGRASLARPSHRLLSEDEVIELVRGDLITCGSHTETHPVLGSLTDEAQRRELAGSRLWLEKLLRRPVRTLAYPFGQKTHYTRSTVEAARQCGYLCACANFSGVISSTTPPFEWPRLQVQDWNLEAFSHAINDLLN